MSIVVPPYYEGKNDYETHHRILWEPSRQVASRWHDTAGMCHPMALCT